MILRNLVREARKRAGLTQAELGRRAGVAPSTVARAEPGARAPSTDLVDRLVRAAGFEIRVRLGEPDPETRSVFARTLSRTPAQRLADATRAAQFVLAAGNSCASGAVTDPPFDPAAMLAVLRGADSH